jgi:hypothetical protein
MASNEESKEGEVNKGLKRCRYFALEVFLEEIVDGVGRVSRD